MCFTVKESPQNSHVGRLSPDNKYERVKRPWPTLSLLMSTESLPERVAMFHCTNFWVKRMKFTTLAAVPHILSLIHTEHRDARYKFFCWNFHTCNGLRKSWFGCSVSPPIAANVNMTGYPAHYYCFATLSKLCLVFYYTI